MLLESDSLSNIYGMTARDRHDLPDQPTARRNLPVAGNSMRRTAADQPISGGFVIDSREAGRGDVFWALGGQQTHGVRFVADAFARGAAGVVTDQPLDKMAVDVPGDKFAIVVHDAVEALGPRGCSGARAYFVKLAWSP